ncbi:MAG: hypothetical protein ABFS45_23530 [Pseudomonadota bacterium]
MAIKNRVDRLEKARQQGQPLDLFEILGVPEEVREPIRRYWQNETEEDYHSLLAKFPEHRDAISGFILDTGCL